MVRAKKTGDDCPPHHDHRRHAEEAYLGQKLEEHAVRMPRREAVGVEVAGWLEGPWKRARTCTGNRVGQPRIHRRGPEGGPHSDWRDVQCSRQQGCARSAQPEADSESRNNDDRETDKLAGERWSTERVKGDDDDCCTKSCEPD